MYLSSGGHNSVPDRVAVSGHCCGKHSGDGLIQDKQSFEDCEQLLSAEPSLRRLDHRHLVNEPVHHLHHHGPVGPGAPGLRPVAGYRLCGQQCFRHEPARHQL